MSRMCVQFSAVLIALCGWADADSLLSNVFGDGMVLQRAPARAMIFGAATPNATVTTTVGTLSFTSTADADGIWRQRLPPANASRTGVNISVSSGNLTAHLKDVLFGDVYICGGQVGVGVCV